MIVCSGICPFDDWMAADWDDVYERTNAVNVKGTVNCVRAALPRMMERGRGRIVLVGSLAGRTGGLLSGPHYVASKGAVGALVRWFARIGAPRNVLVNGVAPGPVNTGMIAGRNLNMASIPLGRIAEPEELAAPIAFLVLAGRKLHLRGDARRQWRSLYVVTGRFQNALHLRKIANAFEITRDFARHRVGPPRLTSLNEYCSLKRKHDD